MGFVIDMISGEIQDISRPVKTRLESSDKSQHQVYEIIDRSPAIQEYVPLDKAPVNPVVPESIRHIDIDTFLDQM